MSIETLVAEIVKDAGHVETRIKGGSLSEKLQSGRDLLKQLSDHLTHAASASEEAFKAADAAFDVTKAAVERIKRQMEASAKTGTLDTPANPVAQATFKTVRDLDALKQAPTAGFVGRLMARESEGEISQEEAVKSAYGEAMWDAVKAQSSVTVAGGGGLIAPTFAGQIIEQLTNATVVRRMNPQPIPVYGTMTIPTEESAPEGHELDEGDPNTTEDFGFGEISVTPRRIAASVVVPRQMIRNARLAPSAVRGLEQFMQRRLLDQARQKEDLNHLFGDGTNNKILGIRNQILASQLTGISGTDFDDIEKDLAALPTALLSKNLPLTEDTGYYVMCARTLDALERLRVPTSNEKVFSSLTTTGRLNRYRVIVSEQIPSNGGVGSNEAQILFFHGPSIILAEAGNPEMRISTEGSYEQMVNGSPVTRSLMARNQMGVFLEMESDVRLEYAFAGAGLTGVTY